MIGRLFESLARQITDTLKISDLKNEFNERFKNLESRITVDNARLIELDRLKKDLQDIRTQLWEQKASGSSNSLAKPLPGYLRLNADGIKIAQLEGLHPLEKVMKVILCNCSPNTLW
ncbi:hypothetical protein P879_10683 [Paragonimus westermani]|uniref:Uncharacterized protein n=1 Tax=Paragonimus westermani TaxID=34504 RepID=A0A8T0DCG2_9TREM|nr:hypothetical protein P879_10683 [Paragonimus westermani]